jgi:hypothetical protein
MDRRAGFFLGAAVVCLVMSLVIDAELRYVTYWLAGVYALLALLSSLDAIGRRGRRNSHPQ